MGNNTERNNTLAAVAEQSDLQLLAAHLPGDNLPTPGAPGLIDIAEVDDNIGPKQGDIGHYGLTDDLTPTLHGNIEGGDGLVMQVYANTEYLGSVMISEGGDWEFTTKQLQADSKYTFELLLKDPVSSEILVSMPYTIITTETGMDALHAPEIDGIWDDAGNAQGPVHNGDTTDDASPTIFGKADADSLVVILDNGKAIGSVTADDKGNWTFTPGTDLADGQHDITAVTQDADGHQSQPSDAIDFTIDTSGLGPTGPDAATDIQLWDDVGDIQGYITNDTVTDDNKPTLSGNATAGDIVYVYDGKTEIGSVLVQPNGIWSFEPGLSLLDGPHSFTTVVKDVLGNQSAESAAINFTVDTVSTTPVVESVIDNYGDATGVIANGGKTDDTTPSLSGSAEANSTVEVFVKGPDGKEASLGFAQADNSGHWQMTVSEAQALTTTGGYTFSAEARDVAGNLSARSAGYSINYLTDQTEPGLPGLSYITDDNQEHHQVYGENYYTPGNATTPVVIDGHRKLISEGKETLFNDKTPTLHGTGTPDSEVAIYIEHLQRWDPSFSYGYKNSEFGMYQGKATVDHDGNWSFTSDLTKYFSSSSSAVGVAWRIVPVDEHGNEITTNQIMTGSYLIINQNDSTTSDTPEPENTPGLPGLSYITDDNQEHHQVYGENYYTPGNATTPVVIDGHRKLISEGKETLFNDKTPTLHGTGTPDSEVAIYIEHLQRWDPSFSYGYKNSEFGMYQGKATVDHDGNWSFTSDLTKYFSSSSSAVGVAWRIVPVDEHGNEITTNQIMTGSYLIINQNDPTTVQTLAAETDHHNDVVSLSTLTTDEQTLLSKHATVELHDNNQENVRTLKLSVDDILNHAQQDMFIQDGKQQMAVTGDAGDMVELKLENVTQQWHDAGQSTVAGVTYEVYHNEGSTAELLIQQGVELHQS